MKRVESECYWDAEAWDADARVYVGASDGQTNHFQAMDSDLAAAVAAERGHSSTAAAAAATAATAKLHGHAVEPSMKFVEQASADYWDSAFEAPAATGSRSLFALSGTAEQLLGTQASVAKAPAAGMTRAGSESPASSG
ncbi:unnamed protein product, partial [Polarella glacialis]